MQISKSTFDFLKDLKKNNDRDWFTKNKSLYTAAHENMIGFADALLEKMNKIDGIETSNGKKSLMRIYRDVRFSKDKSPYKTNFGGGFKRATAARRGGYYYHIQPGSCFLGGGFWGPEKDDLLLVRQQIDMNSEPLRKVLSSKKFKDYFGEMTGEQLKTCPKGFDKESPNIDLLKYKQFLAGRQFTDQEVLSKDFVDIAADTFKAMLPFFDVMSEYLTTDLNGVSTID